jgi:hypothetical protein
MDLLVDTVPGLLVVGILLLWLDTFRQHRKTKEDLARSRGLLSRTRLQRWTKDR